MEATRDVNSLHDEWEGPLASLLDELTEVQTELLQVLQAKGERMARQDLEGVEQLQPRAQQLLARLQTCQQRRAAILESVTPPGTGKVSLGRLANRASRGQRDNLTRRVKQSSQRMRLLQHHSVMNWVLAQRTLLHLAQMLEIIATGGRLQATYGGNASTGSGGALVDQEA